MKSKVIYNLTSALLGMIILIFAVEIQLVEADGTIYIRADGSIDPPTAPLTTADNVTYIFTGNIYDEIVVERDNIILDGVGYILQGKIGSQRGVSLSGRSNVTIQNINLKKFWCGIYLDHSSNNTISANNLSNYNYGVYLVYSQNNNVSGNVVANHSCSAIYLFQSSNNSIKGNKIRSNAYGVRLDYSSNNNIVGNDVNNNDYGTYLDHSLDNSIFHNNFTNNLSQVYSYSSTNIWDNGYPSGGNCWSDYVGTDLFSGPYQNETGSDGIGDTPYIIDAENIDHYPLMPPLVHDITITTITPSKTISGQSYSTNINVTLLNQGNYTETFNVTIYANLTEIGMQEVTLSSGNSIILTFSWGTTVFGKGQYLIWGYAWPVSGETDLEDNIYVDGLVKVTIPGDLDGDFKVKLADLVILAQHYGHRPPDEHIPNSVECNRCFNADIDSNKIVGLSDLVILAKHYGQESP